MSIIYPNSDGHPALEVDETGSAALLTTNLRGLDVRNVDCSHLKLISCDLTDSSFYGAMFLCTSFEKCDLTRVKFDSSFLKFANFKDCNLALARILDSDLRSSNFENVAAEGLQIEQSNLEESHWKNVDLYWATLSDLNCRKCQVIDGSFAGVAMRQVFAQMAVFARIKFPADSLGHKSTISHCDFSGSQFDDIKLDGAVCIDVLLPGAVNELKSSP